MMRCASTLCAAVALIGFSLTVGSSGELSAAAAALQVQKNPIPSSASSIKAGSLVFARICRACHGLQGKGDGTAAPLGSKPANLVAGKWKHGGSDAEIFKTIKEGVAPDYFMQAMADKLSDDEIWNTINFIRDLAKRVNAKK